VHPSCTFPPTLKRRCRIEPGFREPCRHTGENWTGYDGLTIADRRFTILRKAASVHRMNPDCLGSIVGYGGVRRAAVPRRAAK